MRGSLDWRSLLAPIALQVRVTPRPRKILEELVRAAGTSQRLAQRCRIVLLSADGVGNGAQGRKLDVDRQLARRWRSRWADAQPMISELVRRKASDKDLKAAICDVLSDGARSGAPATFTPEVIVQIIALACEPPADSGLPISHWTPPELAREAIRRKIVVSISPRQVDRFLSRSTFGHTRHATG